MISDLVLILLAVLTWTNGWRYYSFLPIIIGWPVVFFLAKTAPSHSFLFGICGNLVIAIVLCLMLWKGRPYKNKKKGLNSQAKGGEKNGIHL